MNVVIAVLLDEFITSVAKDKAEERMKKEDDEASEVAVLDPLLASLVAFNTSKDLSDRIKAIYQVLDSDESGGLSYSEFADGLRRLRLSVPIVLSIEDYVSRLARSVVAFAMLSRHLLILPVSRVSCTLSCLPTAHHSLDGHCL
eukprot:1198427-Rhodomonas_salina.2